MSQNKLTPHEQQLLEALEAIHRTINLPPGLEKKATEVIRKAKGE